MLLGHFNPVSVILTYALTMELIFMLVMPEIYFSRKYRPHIKMIFFEIFII